MTFPFTHIWSYITWQCVDVHLNGRSIELKEHTANHEFIVLFLQATTVRVEVTWRHSCSATGGHTAPLAPPYLVSVNQALGQTSQASLHRRNATTAQVTSGYWVYRMFSQQQRYVLISFHTSSILYKDYFCICVKNNTLDENFPTVYLHLPNSTCRGHVSYPEEKNLSVTNQLMHLITNQS